MPEGGERNDKIINGHCPACGPGRRADVSAIVIKHFEDHPALYGQKRYRILTCRGCGEIYFQRGVLFSETCEMRENPSTGEVEEFYPERVAHWPAAAKRAEPGWKYQLDTSLIDLLDEVYGALNNDTHVLAALGMRMAVDRAAQLLGVDHTLTFSAKLNRLREIGSLGAAEGAALDVLAEADRAAARRGWRPAPEQLDAMMATIEQFLYRNFVLPQETARLSDKVPGSS
jgi:hypothetical protein